MENVTANSIYKSQLFRFKEVSWVQKDQIPNLELAYDMLPLMEMMEAPNKSEFLLSPPYRGRLGERNFLVFYQIT